ncbi:MAG: glycosyltransferase family 4 protein [Acidimicrobiia bacterium]|nr:glycosyltransferase family 4 protein [Acidimicrobiia bacterium]
MTRPHVLVAVKGLGIGGAERLIAEGARYWDRDRFDYRVVYMLPWKNQLVGDIESYDVPVECLGGERGRAPVWAMRLRKYVKDIRADLIHVHSPAVAVAARAVVTKPIVYTEHNLADSYRQPTKLLNRMTYGRNAAVTAVSEQVAASASAFAGPKPVVVPNGVSVAIDPDAAASARAELGIRPQDPLVVHVGNIRPGKGHDTLIDAVAHLPDKVTVVSIGGEKHSGDLARVQAASEKAGVSGQLRFLGRREDALRFVAAADVYVNPADHEGLPVTILEALALARPVVATAVGGVPTVVKSQQTGVLVAPKEPAALAAEICKLLDDSEFAAQLGSSGKQLVADDFSLEPMIRSFERIYAEVLDG